MDEDRGQGVVKREPSSTKQAVDDVIAGTQTEHEGDAERSSSGAQGAIGGSEDKSALSAVNKTAAMGPSDKLVVPLHAETLAVSRRQVETGRVRVSTVTTTKDALVDELLARDQVEIERIPVGRVVETTPLIREEGDTTIIPVIEETIVVEKRLVLKEEIHVRRVRTMEQHRETVVLREQEAVISRVEPDAASGE